ncbi:DNA-binding protein [Pseudomonas sp.]|uniref:DNA-binding protein n=1 Tax=Pseudomonas sp. TaxID=306 RepID=UPI0028AB89CE|nr:DNA-binding protein [Pseudomonas sp.]
MARGGINKAVVQQARQVLISRGEYPSIDAVRIELGNTGSKTTIHRYLKELEGSKPVALQGQAALSESLTRLVSQLAAQLQEEGDARIEQAEAAFNEERDQLAAQLQLAQQALAAAHQQQQIQAAALAAESERLVTAQHSLQAEQLRSASLGQAVGELQLRLADKEEQVRSLEDKHRHAQLELRQLQQGMIAKQDELTRLHRDNERMLGEHRQATSDCKAKAELLEQRDAQIQGLRTILAQAQGASDEMRRQLHMQTQSLEEHRAICSEQSRQLQQLQDELRKRDETLQAQKGRQAGN